MTTRKVVSKSKEASTNIVEKLLFSGPCVCDECKIEREQTLTNQMPKAPKKTKNMKKHCYYCNNNDYQKNCYRCEKKLCSQCILKGKHCTNGCSTIFCEICLASPNFYHELVFKCMKCKNDYCGRCFENIQFSCESHCMNCVSTQEDLICANPKCKEEVDCTDCGYHEDCQKFFCLICYQTHEDKDCEYCHKKVYEPFVNLGHNYCSKICCAKGAFKLKPNIE